MMMIEGNPFENKTDPELGAKVEQHLIQCGLEKPRKDKTDDGLDKQTKVTAVYNSLVNIFRIFNQGRDDPDMMKNALRIAYHWTDKKFSGTDYANFPRISKSTIATDDDGIVIKKNIPLNSICEHHLETIDGTAILAYYPKDNQVLGLSKLTRIVQFFSARPQLQERMTNQIAKAFSFVAETPDVAVIIESQHFCVKTRGVHIDESKMITACWEGKFKDIEIRNNLYHLIGVER